MRAGVGLWRGKPQSFDDEVEPPAPPIGYAEIPGEIDASQYDPDVAVPALRADPGRRACRCRRASR